jgi:multidrug efflux pump subunit AcrA (membrane-fusion protein)
VIALAAEIAPAARRYRRLLAMVLVLLAAALCVVLARRQSATKITVSPGQLETRIIARATVVPASGIARIRAPAPGTVRAVHVRSGDPIEKGSALFALAPDTADESAPLRSVLAPVSGTILSRLIHPGDTLAEPAGVVLFEIADLTHLEARVEIEESSASSIAPGQPLTLRRRGGGATLAERKLERVGPTLERRQIGSSDARVRAEGPVRPAWMTLAQPGGFVVGQEIEAVIALSPISAAAKLPRDAVRIEDGRAIVEVPGFVFSRHVPVSLGAADDQSVEVFGLEAGSQVLVRPAF